MATTVYNDSYISFIETPMEDFGDPNTWKDFLEVQLNFQPESVGSFWVEAENEYGLRSGTAARAPKALTTTNLKNGAKTFLNLKGRRVKIRLWVITNNFTPWVLRDISVGWLPGKEN